MSEKADEKVNEDMNERVGVIQQMLLFGEGRGVT